MTGFKQVLVKPAQREKLLKINSEPNKAINKLLNTHQKDAIGKLRKISLLVLEDVWWDFSANEGHASVGPLMQTLTRLHGPLKSYHLNFFDSASLQNALNHGLTVPDGRILLHIGSHGTSKMIGNAQAEKTLRKIASLEPTGGKRLEGLILSSCQVGNNKKALESVLKGQLNWVLAYKANIDWLGSSMVDAAIINAVCLEKNADYCESADRICETIAKGLRCFNPDWKIDDGGGEKQVGAKTLRQAIALWVRPQKGRNPIDKTEELIELAWGK